MIRRIPEITAEQENFRLEARLPRARGLEHNYRPGLAAGLTDTTGE